MMKNSTVRRKCHFYLMNSNKNLTNCLCSIFLFQKNLTWDRNWRENWQYYLAMRLSIVFHFHDDVSRKMKRKDCPWNFITFISKVKKEKDTERMKCVICKKFFLVRMYEISRWVKVFEKLTYLGRVSFVANFCILNYMWKLMFLFGELLK